MAIVLSLSFGIFTFLLVRFYWLSVCGLLLDANRIGLTPIKPELSTGKRISIRNRINSVFASN